MDQNPPKESRPPINLRIKFRSESVEQFIERYAVDVSRGGIFIRTRDPLAVGTQLKLDFQFQNGTALMAGDGTVVWIREFDANRTSVPPGMGVRFDKLTPESQAVLEQLLIEKAKRERSGVPGSGSQGAGGIAVRRSSNTFAAVDAQSASTAGSPPVSGGAGGPTAIPVAVADAPSGPLAAVTANAAAALQPGAGGPVGVGPLAGLTPKDEAGPLYRPLGTARNPFSAVGTPASPPSAGETAASEAPEESAAPFDDINDEPTQIAGRLPSFLLSDDEATVANGQMPKDLGEADDDLATSAKASARKSAGDKSASDTDSRSATRSPLPGMRRTESPPAGARAIASTGAAPSFTATESSRTSEQAGQGKAGSPAADAAPKADDPGRTIPDVPSEAIAAAAPIPGGRKSDRRQPAALVLGATVLVLGAAGIFLFRFFGSHATQSAPSMASGAATIGAAATSPEPTAAAQPSAAPAEQAKPPSEAAAGGAAAEALLPPSPAAAAPQAANVAAADDAAGRPTAPAEPTTRRVSKHRAPHGQREAPGGPAAAMAASAPNDKTGQLAGSEGAAPAGAPTAAGATVPGTSAAAASPSTGKTDEGTTGAGGDGEPPVRQVRVTSRPDGADVIVDGQTVGKTPYTVTVADVSATHSVAVHKDGFEPFEQTVSASSAWSKAKAAKGKPATQLLKVNARLKAIAGAEVRPAAEPEAAAKAERPPAPAEERPAATPDSPTPP